MGFLVYYVRNNTEFDDCGILIGFFESLDNINYDRICKMINDYIHEFSDSNTIENINDNDDFIFGSFYVKEIQINNGIFEKIPYFGHSNYLDFMATFENYSLDRKQKKLVKTKKDH